jgi:hypothetical protein
MIRSIWSSWETVPNSMPKGNGTNTRDWVSFFIFWLCSLPAIWVSLPEYAPNLATRCEDVTKSHQVSGAPDQASVYRQVIRRAYGGNCFLRRHSRRFILLDPYADATLDLGHC